MLAEHTFRTVLFASAMALSVVPKAPGQLIERADLIKLLRSFRAEIVDMEFIYEGKLRVLAAPDFEKVPAQVRRGKARNRDRPISFQGRFAMRGDDNAHLDVYTWDGIDDGSIARIVSSLPGDGKLHSQGFHPGGGPLGTERVEPGQLTYFYQSCYPLRLYVAPVLLLGLQSQESSYECLGSEVIANRKCTVVRLTDQGIAQIFWVDLERQGQVVRQDYLETIREPALLGHT